jgi:hypothetical protein
VVLRLQCSAQQQELTALACLWLPQRQKAMASLMNYLIGFDVAFIGTIPWRF